MLYMPRQAPEQLWQLVHVHGTATVPGEDQVSAAKTTLLDCLIMQQLSGRQQKYRHFSWNFIDRTIGGASVAVMQHSPIAA